MAGEGVIVSEDAAVGLAHYLADIGRLGKRTARNVGAAIQSSCDAQWGMASVKQFKDATGVGWIVDLSEKFNGEVLYAIIRSEKGERHVTKVVDDDKFREMFPSATKRVDPEPTVNPEDTLDGESQADPVGTAQQMVKSLRAKIKQLEVQKEQLTTELTSVRQIDPAGPALVRWKRIIKTDDSQEFNNGDERQITVGEVDVEIHRLLEIGIRPEHIEVWSRRQVPKVKVELE